MPAPHEVGTTKAGGPETTAADPTVIEKHSVRLHGHATSVSLERGFWTLLSEEAARQGLSLNALITRIDDQRVQHGVRRTGNLSSRLRVYLLAVALDRPPR